jgi:hypothetical protein
MVHTCKKDFAVIKCLDEYCIFSLNVNFVTCCVSLKTNCVRDLEKNHPDYKSNPTLNCIFERFFLLVCL